jgi:hypothetical protein
MRRAACVTRDRNSTADETRRARPSSSLSTDSRDYVSGFGFPVGDNLLLESLGRLNDLQVSDDQTELINLNLGRAPLIKP